MIVHEYILPVQRGQSFRIYPIGDIHIELKACDRAKLKAYVEKIAGDEHGVYICVGDLHDARVPGDRHWEPNVIRDEYLLDLDNYSNRVLDDVLDILGPLKGRMGAIVEGNHDRFRQWTGFTAAVSRHLNAAYLQGEGGLNIVVRDPRLSKSRGGQGQSSARYAIYATHGAGSGRLPGAKLNRANERLNWAIADIYISGHVHDSMARQVGRIDIKHSKGDRLAERPAVMIVTPAFVNSRVAGTVNYIGRASLPQTDPTIRYVEVHFPTSHRFRADSYQVHEFIG